MDEFSLSVFFIEFISTFLKQKYSFWKTQRRRIFIRLKSLRRKKIEDFQ